MCNSLDKNRLNYLLLPLVLLPPPDERDEPIDLDAADDGRAVGEDLLVWLVEGRAVVDPRDWLVDGRADGEDPWLVDGRVAGRADGVDPWLVDGRVAGRADGVDPWLVDGRVAGRADGADPWPVDGRVETEALLL